MEENSDSLFTILFFSSINFMEKKLLSLKNTILLKKYNSLNFKRSS